MKSLLVAIRWPFSTLAAILLQPDKVCHIYWGASVGFTFGLWMGWWAMIAVLAAAVLKELYDLFHPPNKCEAWDVAATLLGGALAIVVIQLHGRFP